MSVIFTSNFKETHGVLPAKDYKGFNLGNSIEDYTLPSLNLFPKVHKLKEKVSIESESLIYRFSQA